jgi:midasin (ATPase involved in ribosome maturation)
MNSLACHMLVYVCLPGRNLKVHAVPKTPGWYNWLLNLSHKHESNRSYFISGKACQFKEPVLLVGETGCGKTSVCQMLAAMHHQSLFTVNCHMHTESSDFLGGLRPVREHTSVSVQLLCILNWLLVQWNLDLSFFKGMEKTNECGKTINAGSYYTL